MRPIKNKTATSKGYMCKVCGAPHSGTAVGTIKIVNACYADLCDLSGNISSANYEEEIRIEPMSIEKYICENCNSSSHTVGGLFMSYDKNLSKRLYGDRYGSY